MEKLIVETYLVGRKENYENRVIKEIITLSCKLEFNLFEHGTTYPVIELINSAATKNEELNLWIQTNLSRDRSIIKFSSEVPLVDMLDTEDLVYTTNERENRHALMCSFQKRIMDVIVAANIADAGSFEVLWSKTRIDQRLYETSLIPEIVIDIFEIALNVAYQYEWPVIRELPFLQVWNWSHQNHKIFDDFKKGGRVSRAVNAFSRLLESPTPQDFSQYLLWSMVGIETLYVRGKVSIMEQVREKIQIF